MNNVTLLIYQIYAPQAKKSRFYENLLFAFIILAKVIAGVLTLGDAFERDDLVNI